MTAAHKFNAMIQRVGAPLRGCFAGSRRRKKQQHWEAEWSRADYQPPWLGRGISSEIVDAVRQGWFPAGSSALDIGCGQGEVAGWLSEQGFPTVGIDLAPAAIARARTRYPESPGRLEFQAADVLAWQPPAGRFQVLVDRGCLHQIPPVDYPAYGRTLCRAAAPHARMLLFCKAFRQGQSLDDAAEQRRVSAMVQSALGEEFVIERVANTFLDRHQGALPNSALGGLVYSIARRPPTGGT